LAERGLKPAIFRSRVERSTNRAIDPTVIDPKKLEVYILLSNNHVCKKGKAVQGQIFLNSHVKFQEGIKCTKDKEQ
jgi:hypothetical protein